MKVIQSYWSLPAKNNSNEDSFGRRNGGWISEKYHAMSWTLSCLKLREFYSEVELFTDKAGYSWLIDQLDLPYTKITTSLDRINNINPSLWALPKLYTILQQEEPFLHIDGDIYIWERFSEKFLQSQLFVQNIEYEDMKEQDFGIYISSLKKLQKNISLLPPFVDEVLTKYELQGTIEAYNTGIIGGQDIRFIKKYAKFVFDFLQEHKETPFGSSDMNLIEQLFLFCLCEMNDISVKVLFGREKAISENGYASMTEFNLIPTIKKYIHVIGLSKKEEMFCLQLEKRLSYEYPKMYKHINSIYKGSPKKYIIPESTFKPASQIDTIYFPITCALLREKNVKHTYRSKVGFFKSVEMIINTSTDTSFINKLNDYFQIETFIYNNSVKKRGTSGKKILKLLYSASIDEILQLKFTLNVSKLSIAYLFCEYSSPISIKYLQSTLNTYQPLNKDKADLMMITSGLSKEELYFNKLTGWEIFLTYFDGYQFSGAELLGIISKNKIFYTSTSKELTESVFSFLTMYSLYYDYLILA